MTKPPGAPDAGAGIGTLQGGKGKQRSSGREKDAILDFQHEFPLEGYRRTVGLPS